MIDKAFAIQEIAKKALMNPQTARYAGRVLGATNEEDRSNALVEFGMDLTAVMATLMCELLMTADDLTALTKTIEEITEFGKDN